MPQRGASFPASDVLRARFRVAASCDLPAH